MKKPKYYKRMISFIREEWKNSSCDILLINYLGVCDVEPDDHNFLITAKDDGNLVFFLETVNCNESGELFKDDDEDTCYATKRLPIQAISAIKNINISTIKTLYDDK